MVHSMTAFARVERAGSQGTLVWELRSVNHRYLEPHLRLPEALRDLEGGVREGLRQGLSRGKVECTLRLNEDSNGKPLKVDHERAAQLVAAAEEVASLIKQPAPLNPLEVLSWPGVLVADTSDPQALNAEAMALFDEALAELKAGRQREGQELARLINERLDNMASEVTTLRAWCRRCWRRSGRRFSTASATCKPSWTHSAWSKRWYCWPRKATWQRSSTASAPTSPKCVACSRVAAPLAGAWTS